MNEFEKELQRVLATARPVIDWSTALPAAGVDGPDVWHHEDPDLWPMSGPPEEYALPPLVSWSEHLRLLAEKAYRTTYDRYLEPGESYAFTWPPRGALWSPGIWCRPDDEEPAAWMWYLAIERVGDDQVETEEPWLMGRTEVDPRIVEYSVFGGDGAHQYVEALQELVERVAGGARPNPPPHT